MKVGIIGSMHFSENMLEAAEQLRALGHSVLLSNFVNTFPGKSDEEKESIKLRQKFSEDAMKRDWETMKLADVLLVLNFERHDIPNYIGGNTFLEMGFAHVLDKKIFLYHPIPEIPYYKTEIEAMRPVIINGDLSKIV